MDTISYTNIIIAVNLYSTAQPGSNKRKISNIEWQIGDDELILNNETY